MLSPEDFDYFAEPDFDEDYGPDPEEDFLIEEALRQELHALDAAEEFDWWSSLSPYGQDAYNGDRFEDA